MARPRKYNVIIPNLSCFTDARTKRVYWRYKHPVTGKFHGLGTDEAEAKAIAIEANSRLSENQMRHLIKARNKLAESLNTSITTSGWSEKYLQLQTRRVKSGELKTKTIQQKKLVLDVLVPEIGMKPLDQVTVKDINALMEPYLERNKNSMALLVRTICIDFFKEAQRAGEVSPGFNPALSTRTPRAKVMRARLDLPTWKKIYAHAEKPRYMQRAMLLAVVSGQRISDISKMRFSDVWDDHLHIVQQKTGARIALPLSLHCNALGISLREIIGQCRDRILSPYLLHHRDDKGPSKRGEQVKPHSLRDNFRLAREASGLIWEEGQAPSFHEQRSLSERLYRAQGIDTQTLLGHSNQAMTDKYNDERSSEWKKLIF